MLPIGMPAIDALGSPALSVLRRLAQGNVVSMTAFGRASGLPPAAARRLRDRLADAGLLHVRRRPQGSVMIVHVELTPLGDTVVALIREIEDAIARSAPAP